MEPVVCYLMLKALGNSVGRALNVALDGTSRVLPNVEVGH